MSELTIGLMVLATYALLIIGILLFFRGSHCWDDDDLRQESMASGDSGWAPSHEGGKGSLMALRGIIDPSVLGGKSSEEYVRDVRDHWGDSEWPPSLDDGMLGPRDMTRWPRRDWLPGEGRE